MDLRFWVAYIAALSDIRGARGGRELSPEMASLLATLISDEYAVRDPKLETATEFQYYVQRHGVKKDWNQPSFKEMAVSLNLAHQFMRQLVTEKDRMQKSLGWAAVWIKVLTAAVIASWAVILVLVKAILSHWI